MRTLKKEQSITTMMSIHGFEPIPLFRHEETATATKKEKAGESRDSYRYC